uniref:Uncharacterized protein n=1 Tax=Arion vulgaris TaxID=1028688 RepID=A0A0B7B7I5_9EUPU
MEGIAEGKKTFITWRGASRSGLTVGYQSAASGQGTEFIGDPLQSTFNVETAPADDYFCNLNLCSVWMRLPEI